MDTEYDVIVIGTGLKESVLSVLLSMSGRKVLVLDKNVYYGGESASLNLTNLYNRLAPGKQPPQSFGHNREWNVDLIPKFVLASGKLVKILRLTKTSKYLEWKVLDGSYVYQYQKATFLTNTKYIHKVPATEMEALSSPLMGFFEKTRCHNFYKYIANFDENDEETWKGLNPFVDPMNMFYKSYGLEDSTIAFLGHAVALHTTDDYLNEPGIITIKKIKLYMNSLIRFGDSPFIYPIYGLGGLPEAFSRRCAIHGGVHMLNKRVKSFLFDEMGKVSGITTTDGETGRCKMVVTDPGNYLEIAAATNISAKDRLKKIGQVCRFIAILNHPIPGTSDASSCQIIIPQKELNRKHDVYITLVSSSHGVSAKGKYVSIISTTVETSNPQKEIKPALNLLGTIEDSFFILSDIYVPTDAVNSDNIFISSSYDATSHFETASDDILKMWRQ